MKNREKTGKAFRIKWLLLALVAAALIFVPAASHKVSAAKLVYTVKFNNNSGTSKSKTYTALTRNVTLNTTIRLPAVPKAVGYQNLGWTTRKGSSKVVYKAGARVKVRKDMTPPNQATATRLAVHIQHHPHPHTSAQPHTSNTAAYIHKSTTSHHHNQELLKKARGVCRGAVALRPLCGFHFFPKLNHRLINKFLFFVSF